MFELILLEEDIKGWFELVIMHQQQHFAFQAYIVSPYHSQQPSPAISIVFDWGCSESWSGQEIDDRYKPWNAVLIKKVSNVPMHALLHTFLYHEQNSSIDEYSTSLIHMRQDDHSVQVQLQLLLHLQMHLW